MPPLPSTTASPENPLLTVDTAIARERVRRGLFGADDDRTHAAPKLGRFTVVETIGAGAMGVVYAAHDDRLDRKVALKVLRASHGNPRARNRLLREARALAQLSDPHVVAIFEVGVHDDQVWIAMEYVAGQTLTKWLGPDRSSGSRRSQSEILGAFVQAGQGLAAAHGRGLVHRDFKPDNVLVMTAGVVKVVDFGLATAFDGGPSDDRGSQDDPMATVIDPLAEAAAITASGSVAGTPGYMAPEQFVGAPLDARADQFAFCVALWEALFGAPPFPRTSLANLVLAVQSGAIEAPPAGSGVPASIRRALERGMSPSREDRFVDMHALLGALTRGPRRRTRLAVAAAVVLAGGVTAYAVDRERFVVPCTEVEPLPGWNDEVRRTTRAALVTSGIAEADATWTRLEQSVDDYARRWQDERNAACVAAHVDRTQSEPAFDRRVACGERRAAELKAVLGRIAIADATALEHAIPAVARLPDPRECADDELLGRRAPPPTETGARAAYLAWQDEHAAAEAAYAMNDLEDARTRAEATIVHARALERADLEAEGRYLLARIDLDAGDLADAREAFEAAYWGAHASGHDEIAALAAIDLGELDGDERPESAAAWLKHAEAEVERLDAEGPLRGRLLTNLGIAAMRARDLDRSLALQQRALAIFEGLEGEDGLGTGVVLMNIGTVQFLQNAPDDETRATLLRAREIFAERLGPTHPEVGEPLMLLASLDHRAGRLDEAEAEFRETLTLLETAYGEGHIRTAASLNGLALVAESRGNDEQALALLERGMDVIATHSSPDDLRVGTLETNIVDVLSRLGRHDEALSRARHVLATFRGKVGEEHPGTSDGYCMIGRELRLLGRDAEAVEPLEACLRVRLVLGAPARYRWKPRLDLARVLLATRGDTARAKELLASARADAVEIDDKDAIAEIDAVTVPR